MEFWRFQLIEQPILSNGQWISLELRYILSNPNIFISEIARSCKTSKQIDSCETARWRYRCGFGLSPGQEASECFSWEMCPVSRPHHLVLLIFFMKKMSQNTTANVLQTEVSKRPKSQSYLICAKMYYVPLASSQPC